MVDDLSHDAFETLLAGNHLPNLKQAVIDSGVRFRNSFVTSPSCAPSRATYLTGQYAHNHGVFSVTGQDPFTPAIGWRGWFPDGEDPGKNASTLPVWLSETGYTTGFVGKYINGYGSFAPPEITDPKVYIPPGWSDWQGLIDPTTYKVFDYELNDNGVVVAYGDAEEDYQTDVLAARAADFITEASQGTAPFFLTVAPLAPHVEVLNPEELVGGIDPAGGFDLTIRPAPRHAHFADGDEDNGEMPGLPNKASFDEADVSDKPSCPRDPPIEDAINRDPYCVAERTEIDLTEGAVEGLEAMWKSMLAAMLAVDDMIGTLNSALEQAGVLDETVIVFTSDNGWFYGEHRLIGKDLPYEESSRVPLVIRVPNFVGGDSNHLVLNNDLAPTIATLAHAAIPYEPDGFSLISIIAEPQRTDWPRKRALLENWFVPTLHNFANVTYFAIRNVQPGLDYVYATTHAEPASFETITHRELYDLHADIDQLDALTLPPMVESNLDTFLRYFRACRAFVCQVFASL
jgi:arylsulfatase A-like enzyme